MDTTRAMTVARVATRNKPTNAANSDSMVCEKAEINIAAQIEAATTAAGARRGMTKAPNANAAAMPTTTRSRTEGPAVSSTR